MERLGPQADRRQPHRRRDDSDSRAITDSPFVTRHTSHVTFFAAESRNAERKGLLLLAEKT